MRIRTVVLALLFVLPLMAPSAAGAQGTDTVGRSTGLPLPRYVSLAASEVNLRIGPSKSHRIDWVFQRRSLPVKIIAEHDTWRRIEDPAGDLGWVHSSLLSSRRTVMVEGRVLDLRRTPSDDARALARVEPGVIGELFDCHSGWCLVEVAGRRGWLDGASLWGVLPEEFLD